ncbi:MAG TPA: DUF4157 domain-containing protein [Kofleriaceae bacterium]|nr:DUF4157 domain-containing protein [Kofleriaceae bacterium]
MGGGFEKKPGGSSLVDGLSSAGGAEALGPGKRTLTEQLPSAGPVMRKAGAPPTADNAPAQLRASGDAAPSANMHGVAQSGLQGSAQALPHLDLIQRSFGTHDVSGIRAFVGGPAADASRAMGAQAYATGSATAFAATPDLHTAAHEAAHVVQQRAGVQLSGGVGQEGDAYEQHADAVADLVVQGKPAATELDRFAPGGQARATGQQAVQHNKSPATEYPKIITLGTEQVNVKSADEEKEAKEIIDLIKAEYSIDLSSQAGVDAIKKTYTKVPKAVTDTLKTKHWELKELRALKQALAHFAPVLGKQRATSSRKDAAQEVSTGSKVDQGIDMNSAAGTLDTTTMGEYFMNSKNFSMFTAGTDFTGEASVGTFKDNETNLEANAIHELAHGLCRYAESDFIKEMPYWTDLTTKSGKPDAEAPVTTYGQTNAREDLAESVKFYFVEPDTLLKKCSKRHAFVKKMVNAWTPKADQK